jgi:SET domain
MEQTMEHDSSVIEDALALDYNNSLPAPFVNPICILERLKTLQPQCNHDDDDENENVDTTSTSTTSSSIWSNRLQMQQLFTLAEKGWQVLVEWKQTPSHGMGVFALQTITAGTTLRMGHLQYNLLQFHNVNDIESFCTANDTNRNKRENSNDNNGVNQSHEYQERLNYVQDYLWGYYPSSLTDDRGYPNTNTASQQQQQQQNTNTDNNPTQQQFEETRFFGMWIPGNGLNHSTTPNIVYRNHNNDDDFTTTTTRSTNAVSRIELVALTDIEKGEELFDDYRRHGTSAPVWLRKFATEKNITLNFADCNDFVIP